MSLRKQYLDNVVKLISNVSDCKLVGIRMLNSEGFVPYESYTGFTDKFCKSENRLSFDNDRCICMRIVKGKPLSCDSRNMTPFGSFRSDTKSACLNQEFGCFAVVPIRNDNKIIGAIHLADQRQEQVPLKTVQFIESFTRVISDGIHKFDIEDGVRRYYDVQNVVNSLLSMSLQEGLSLGDILSRGLDILLSVSGFGFEDRGAVFIVEGEPKTLHLKAHKGLSECLKKQCNQVILGKCLCGRAAQKRQIQFSSYVDDGHEKKYTGMSSHGHYCVPIVLADNPLGVINLYIKEGAIREPAAETLLTAVANSFAVIIKRKQAEEELYESNKLLNTVLSNTHFLIAYMNTGFDLICVNRAYAQIHRKAPGYFTGRNYFDLYPDFRKKAIFERVLETGEAYYAYAEPLELPDEIGEMMMYWDWSLCPVKDETGEIEGLLMCLVNVTECKWTQNELIKAQKELNESKRLSDIGILAATIAHELRNPLGVIRAATYNLKRKSHDPALESHFNNIEKKILESDQIINNLLFYSRIKMPRYETVRLYDILEECVKAAKDKYKKWEVKLNKRYISIKKIFMDVDPLQIKEVFINLLDNAYESLPHNNGEISVEADLEKDEEVRISFKDNGVGIDEEDLKKIPQSFFTRKETGTGLGLSVSYQIISLHDGKIEAESVKGKGTKFTIILPSKRARK